MMERAQGNPVSGFVRTIAGMPSYMGRFNRNRRLVYANIKFTYGAPFRISVKYLRSEYIVTFPAASPNVVRDVRVTDLLPSIVETCRT